MGKWGMGSGKGEHLGWTGNEGGQCTPGLGGKRSRHTRGVMTSLAE